MQHILKDTTALNHIHKGKTKSPRKTLPESACCFLPAVGHLFTASHNSSVLTTFNIKPSRRTNKP
jgi:hypothetical protein